MSTPERCLGHSPASFLTFLCRPILPESAGTLSVAGCTSNSSLLSGKKSASAAAAGEFHSRMRERVFPMAGLSHQACADRPSPFLGRFACQVWTKAASFEGLISLPILSVRSEEHTSELQ